MVIEDSVKRLVEEATKTEGLLHSVFRIAVQHNHKAILVHIIQEYMHLLSEPLQAEIIRCGMAKKLLDDEENGVHHTQEAAH